MAEKLGRIESRAVVDRMLDEAEKRGFEFAVAVVDPSGHIISAGRTDGATALNVRMAYNKAYTSIIWQADTKSLRERLIEGEKKPMDWFGDPLLTPVWGGVLLRASDGTILGAVGESGPPEEVDEELARIGEKHFKAL
ncbi:uncharacterized protein GlcG (DUF336 family) [Aminobacter lissarensis]|uniref:Uncharacterized protein GlcG (DUF336 family) n=1 Tax=Aminobacter carboxidus TaxID=376165 RepID=A0A8E2BGC3_9HYPH|nr:heme-binding protein [Aminobacter lissarensis]MBB6469135.1 uncharacterized protein GlcG (DUF336 family) [Aminobacter lissarensis]